MVFNDRLMYHLNMGYYTAVNRTPHSSVGYFSAEHKFYHPWSHHANARAFGFNRIKEIMPLKDFMTLPAYVVDEWMEAVTEGEVARFELEKQRADQTMSDAEKAQAEIARQIGLSGKL